MASQPSPIRHLSGGRKNSFVRRALAWGLGTACILGVTLGAYSFGADNPTPSQGQMIDQPQGYQDVSGSSGSNLETAPAGAGQPAGGPGSIEPLVTEPIAYGATYGSIQIPKLGEAWSRPIKEGTGDEVLDSLDPKGRFVVSRYVNTEPFGSSNGPVAVTGHSGATYDLDFWEMVSGNIDAESLSYSPFTRMGELEAGDSLEVTTELGKYTYDLLWSESVTPDRNEVIYNQVYRTQERKPGEEVVNQALVLTTCGVLENWSGDASVRRVYYFELKGFDPVV